MYVKPRVFRERLYVRAFNRLEKAPLPVDQESRKKEGSRIASSVAHIEGETVSL